MNLSGNQQLWQFSPIPNIEESNFNKFLERFYNLGILGLTRDRGIKIIIPFLREQYNDEKEIIKSICDSFFISILEKKLIVKVNDKKIDKETIKEYVSNKEYNIQDIAEMKHEFSPYFHLSTLLGAYHYKKFPIYVLF